MQEEVKRLREEIEELNTSIKYVNTLYSLITLLTHRRCTLAALYLNCFYFLSLFNHSLCQEQLPATGVPSTRHRFDHMQEKFNEYIKSRTLQNWKFWIVSFNARALTENSVSVQTTQVALLKIQAE